MSENTFCAATESMDLSELKDKTFMVAIANDDPDGPSFIFRSLHGPYNFVEMCEAAGNKWKNSLVNPKVYILEKDESAETLYLSRDTTDYIIYHFEDIIMDSILETTLMDKSYTCKAKLLNGTEQDTVADHLKELGETSPDDAQEPSEKGGCGGACGSCSSGCGDK